MKCIFCNQQCLNKENNVCQKCSTSGQEYKLGGENKERRKTLFSICRKCMKISKCCKEKVWECKDGYVCQKCNQPCDTIEQPKDEVKEDWVENKMKEFDNKFDNLWEVKTSGSEAYKYAHEDVRNFLKSSLTQQKEAIEKGWREKIENMKCDYPKSSSQKEHQINIEIIERTVNQIREALLKQTK